MSSPRRSTGIIYNPVAGRARAPDIAAKLAGLLERRGVRCELFATARAGHARELARDYASEFDAIAGIGGDGTINEIINGLADRGCDTPLAIIPGGTANVISRELRLPKRLPALARMIASGPVLAADLGLANGRRFALCCGAGLDARIVREISTGRGEGGIHILHYLRPVLREIFTPCRDRIRVRIDGGELPGEFSYVVAGNFNRYAGPLRLFPGARADDGLLNVMAFRGRTAWALLRLGWRALTGRMREDADTLLRTGREVEFLPAGASGEMLGDDKQLERNMPPQGEDDANTEDAVDAAGSAAARAQPSATESHAPANAARTNESAAPTLSLVDATSDGAIAVQIDGDMGGALPVRLSILPSAIRFCVTQPL